MNWKKEKLGNVIKITSGGTPSRSKNEYYNNGNIPWIKTGDLKVRDLFNASEFITEQGLKNSSAKLFPKNTVLVAMYGATIGANSILRIPACTNQACAALLPSKNIYPLFLYYYTCSIKSRLIAMGMGGGQPNISATILKDISILLPPLPEQKRIADILDKADSLRKKRQKAIEQCDEFLKSTFLHMFGDPVTNPKGWPISEIADFASKVSSGSTPKGGQSVYQRSGIYFIRSQNVRMNYLDYSNIYCISNEIHNKMKRTWVKNDDVLLNITGASIGRVACFKGEDDIANVNQHVCIIRIDKNKVNPIFLSYTISQDSYQRKIIGSNSGGTREAFNFQKIKAFEILMPPLLLQQKFASNVEKTKAIKQNMQKQLKELDDNFNSLMQRAFKGEL